MKFSTKIIATCLMLIVFSTAAFLCTIMVQRGLLATQMQSLVREQAHNEASKIVQTLYFNCLSSEKQNQLRLTHDLQIARELLKQAGQVSLDTNTIEWNAVNQVTQDKAVVRLPKYLVGGNWVGQNITTNQASLIVDDVRHLTRDQCTLFQRMNNEGDMLRVDTSVVGPDGARAIGTYIPHLNADGTPNPVISSVLKGEVYRGRAMVLNEYHAAAYEPVWDAAKARVVGMLFVGVGMAEINRELHDGITNITVGKSGYVYVLDSKGTYVVSQAGKRDGESVWETKDTAGNLVIQSIVTKARKLSDGALASETYPWKNPTDSGSRMKFAMFTYLPAWDWVIAAGAYEDDYEAINIQVTKAMNRLVQWACITAFGIGVFGLVFSYLLSQSVARPIMRVIGRLDGGAAQTLSSASQVSAASQSLAEGSSEQAASIEETSASLEELASMTKRNSENAQKANDLAKQARGAADKGATDMQAMSAAMEAIKVSSDDIAKIIKTIDEIAFQTNILALNAAVEAARAGEAGMGFAVVADEVRNLAQRSAQAAKETAAKIEGAITKTAQGVGISSKVSQTLNEIVLKARQVDELAAEVASASREQTQGITQINTAVGQMDKVTQSNAANAEESAAAAEELNSQAELVKESVVELLGLISGKSKGSRGEGAPAAGPAKNKPGHPVATFKAAAKVHNGSGAVPVARQAEPASRRDEIPMTGDFKDF